MLLQLIVLPYVMNLVLEQKDRKSTRLNSSHDQISYAVFCLKKKKKTKERETSTIQAQPDVGARRHLEQTVATHIQYLNHPGYVAQHYTSARHVLSQNDLRAETCASV